MADTAWVYQCSGTRGEATVALSTAVYPTCNPASQGEWIEISTDPNFLGRPIDEESFGQLFSTAFEILCAAFLVRFLMKTFQGR